jgi:hypothetical protein
MRGSRMPTSITNQYFRVSDIHIGESEFRVDADIVLLYDALIFTLEAKAAFQTRGPSPRVVHPRYSSQDCENLSENAIDGAERLPQNRPTPVGVVSNLRERRWKPLTPPQADRASAHRLSQDPAEAGHGSLKSRLFEAFFTTKPSGAWAWDSRLAVRSSKRTAGGCGPPTMPARGRPFSSPCHGPAPVSHD